MTAAPLELDLEERVARLGETLPSAFGRRAELGDLDDKFVMIDVPYGSQRDDGPEGAAARQVARYRD